ncbi:MAG: hypothetical protein IPL20_00005 [Saprospiraceae bacterium]|nr:hypothetical protein [Saprospiraceae bacterium]
MLSSLGYTTLNNNYKVTESWETISNDDEFDSNCIIPIDTEDPKDSGCFDISLGRINEADWTKFENNGSRCLSFSLKAESQISDQRTGVGLNLFL